MRPGAVRSQTVRAIVLRAAHEEKPIKWMHCDPGVVPLSPDLQIPPSLPVYTTDGLDGAIAIACSSACRVKVFPFNYSTRISVQRRNCLQGLAHSMMFASLSVIVWRTIVLQRQTTLELVFFISLTLALHYQTAPSFQEANAQDSPRAASNWAGTAQSSKKKHHRKKRGARKSQKLMQKTNSAAEPKTPPATDTPNRVEIDPW